MQQANPKTLRAAVAAVREGIGFPRGFGEGMLFQSLSGRNVLVAVKPTSHGRGSIDANDPEPTSPHRLAIRS
jgi:hypothetical protein